MRMLTFDPKILEPFEIGALIFAALAFPAAVEEDKMQSAATAWCARLLAATISANPTDGANWRSDYPHYTDIGEPQIRAALRTANRRLRDRKIAAHMARGFLQEALYKRPAILPDTMSRLSLNQLSRFVLRESGESDPENVEKRAWRESRPIIHLASAFDLVGQSVFAEQIDIPYDLNDIDMHQAVIRLAEQHERVVLDDPRFGVKPEVLIQLRWAE